MERPILFSGFMVRAILEGRKTQTRRIVKPQPDLSILKPSFRELQFEFRRMPVLGPTHEPAEWGFCAKHDKPNCVPVYGYKCPYGLPGDRLWVRETWNIYDYCPGEYGGQGEAGYPLRKIPGVDPGSGYCLEYAANGGDGPWRPSIHMPRWASRINLDIVGIQVERLQDISDDDCEAEGIKQEWTCLNPGTGSYALGNDVRDDFRNLWDSINGKKPGCSWDSNPWLWVISFRRIKP